MWSMCAGGSHRKIKSISRSENKFTWPHESCDALDEFEREDYSTFFDRVENDVKLQIYIICCSFDVNINFQEFSAWEGSKDKLVVIRNSYGMD